MRTLRKLVKRLAPVALLEERGFFYSVDRNAIEELKDKYAGGRCFILGNGPSLNKCDLSRLDDEFTFGVNGIFYKHDEIGFVPSVYVVEDNHVIDDNLDRINDFHCHLKMFPIEYKRRIRTTPNTLFFNLNRSFYEKRSAYFQNPRFSKDCSERIYGLGSVTMVNLQLAYYMGFKEVYLIGMDFSYTIPPSAVVEGLDITSTEDDINHFHPDYFGKGKKWHDPNLEQVLKSYEYSKKVFEKDGRKIYNATVGGKLEVFERVEFEELFKP